MRQKFAIVLIALLCCFAFGCGASSTTLKDISNSSFTTPGQDVILSFEQDYTSGTPVTSVSFAAGCSANPTSPGNCSLQLGSASCNGQFGQSSCVVSNYTVTPALGVGTYEIYAFTILGTSNSIVHSVATSGPIASTVTLPTPAPVTFGQPVYLQPTVAPFPLAGTTDAMGTFEAFTGQTSLGSTYAVPTGFDGRGDVASPGLGFALDIGTTNVDVVYHAPSTGFPTASSAPSAPVAAVVTAATPTIAVSASTDVLNSPVTLTATLAANVTALGLPSGLTFSNMANTQATVTFYSDNVSIGTGTFVPGQQPADPPSYTLTSNTISNGPHAIKAVYTGNTRFLGATSPEIEIAPGTAGTSMVIASSKAPSNLGDAVTFTATITTSAGSPSGTVHFQDLTDPTPIDLGTANVSPGNLSSTAAVTTTALPVGTRTISAVYSGDVSHPGGAVASLTQVVGKAVPTMTFTASSATSVYGQSVTFTVNVTSDNRALTGTITIFDAGLKVGSGTGGTLTGTTGMLPTGLNNLSATYTDDPEISDATATLSHTVNKATASLALSQSSSASAANANVTFTAVVSAVAPGVATPTGSVTFSDGTTVLGTGTIGTGGVAAVTVHSFTQGTHTITASYAGDTNLTAATGTVSHRVTDKATTINVAASPTQASFGAPVALNVTLAGAVSSPTGLVTFTVGNTTLGTATFDSSGTAQLITTTLPVGTSTVTASFAGDGFYPAGDGSVTVVIVPGTSSTVLVSSANPATVGTAVTFTATVTAQGAQPTGSVVFFDGSVAVGQSDLTNGSATLVLNNLTAGTHSIVATYQGSASVDASKSAALVETIGGATNGPATTADAGATGAGSSTTSTVGGGDNSGCSSTPSAPANGVVFLLGVAATVGALRRRKRA